MKTYFTGVPCPKGHVAPRSVHNNSCVECIRGIQAQNYQKNKERIKARIRAYTEVHREQLSAAKVEYQRNRRRTDPIFKIVGLLRNRVRLAIRKKDKSISTMVLIGCTPNRLREHLEGLFLPGMTWDNHGTGWHVDHKRAMSTFDMTDPDQQRAACHFSNLQPLWAIDNLLKGAK